MVRKEILNIIDKVDTTNETEIKLRYSEEVLNEIDEIYKNPDEIFFLESVSSDIELRRLLWNHTYHMKPIKNIDLITFYSEQYPFSSLEPLMIKEGRAKGAVDAHFTYVFDRIFPALEKFMSALVESLDTDDNEIENPDDDKSVDPVDLTPFMSNLPTEIRDLLPQGEFFPIIQLIFHQFGDIIFQITDGLLSLSKPKIVEKGRKHLNELSQYSSLGHDEINNNIERLSKDFQILSPLLSVVWCSDCRRFPQGYIVPHPPDPPMASCPSCSNQMNVGTFYYPHPQLVHMITRNDGLLGLTVIWSMISSGSAWAPGVYLDSISNDTEKDLIFQNSNMDGYGIIECKVHIQDSPDRTIESHLNDDVKQLVKHFKSYTDANIPIDCIFLVTNVPRAIIDETLPKILKKKSIASISRILRIFTPDDYDEFVKAIRNPDLDD